MPDRLVGSAWIQHVPFGMWLMEILRPNVLVELGTLYGVSYCAFCQAVKDLQLPTECYGVDTWEGDGNIASIEPQAFEELSSYHDPRYGTFSKLLRSTFRGALELFEDGTIDVLHIDGFHSYDAVKEDFENWLPKMSQRGVILFHDIAVQEPTYGVWKLWEEISSSYPHFEMQHGFGLGVLAVGAQFPQPLRILTDASEGERLRISEFFNYLGVGVEAIRDLKTERELYRTSRALRLAQTVAIPFQRLSRLF